MRYGVIFQRKGVVSDMAVQCDKCKHIMTNEEHEDYPQCPMCHAAYCTVIPDQECNCDCCEEGD